MSRFLVTLLAIHLNLIKTLVALAIVGWKAEKQQRIRKSTDAVKCSLNMDAANSATSVK